MVEVGEAVVGVQIVFLDFIVVVERTLRHWAFFVYGNGDLAFVELDGHGLFDSAVFSIVFYALVSIAQARVASMMSIS